MTIMTSTTSIMNTSPHTQLTLLFAFIFIAIIGTTAPAATVWSGPPMTFIKAPSTDPAQPANQDRITSRVWITRGGVAGIYNAALESGFTHFMSPADTEWADGSAANYATLTFTDWNSWTKFTHPGPPNTIGVAAVVHLITDDIYIDIKITSWETAGGGGFSYDRSTPGTVANTRPSVTITNPPDGTVLFAPASLVLRATASDSDGSVTNVPFFQDAASLGNAPASPYSAAVTNLAVGDYTFSAVATDNGGLTATNQITVHVVNSDSVLIDGGSIQRPSSTSFQFNYPAIVGRSYIIQRSLALFDWTSILTNVATNSIMIFVATFVR